MTLFEDRKDVFEKKFSRDGVQDFETEARMSKLYGLWAAEKLGLKDDDAQTYAREIVEANLEEPGFEDIYRRVQKDFDEKSIDISRHVMEVMLNKCFTEARKQIEAGE